MRLSTKGEYGVRALYDLAQHYGEGLVQSHEIAERQAISENYLDQLLIALRKAGLITSAVSYTHLDVYKRQSQG